MNRPIPNFVLTTLKIRVLAWTLAVLLVAGCSSPIKMPVGYDKLPKVSSPRQGTIVVKETKDSRSVTNATSIGQIGARPLITKDGRSVAKIMTEALKEALQQCGYTVKPADVPAGNTNAASQLNVILESNITQFLLKSGWTAVGEITLELRLLGPSNQNVLWQSTVHGKEDDWAIVPNALRAAFNTTLKEAIKQFESDSFSQHVAKPKPAS